MAASFRRGVVGHAPSSPPVREMGGQERRRACWAADYLASPGKVQASNNLAMTRLRHLRGHKRCKVTQPADPPLLRELRARTKNITRQTTVAHARGRECCASARGMEGGGERERGRAGARPSLGQPRCGTSVPLRIRSHGGAAACGCEGSLRERGPERDGHPLPTGEGGGERHRK